MTIPSANPSPGQRRLACPRCGAPFGCNLAGGCWCDEESVRLPLPTTGEDCLCPACLRAACDGAEREGDNRSDNGT